MISIFVWFWYIFTVFYANGVGIFSINAHGAYVGAKSTTTKAWPHNVEVWFYADPGKALANSM